MRFTAGKGVNVLYDNIANPQVLPNAFRTIGFDGRLVTAGAHAGPNVTIDFSHLYHKRITIKGRPGYQASDVAKCFAAAAEGKIRAQIERILPLSRAGDAHRLVEFGRVAAHVERDQVAVARDMVETKREALRALKRHLSRDLFKRLAEVPLLAAVDQSRSHAPNIRSQRERRARRMCRHRLALDGELRRGRSELPPPAASAITMAPKPRMNVNR